eukprot:Sspe_Gene.58619::Locus_32159_Transcript_1_2_Confidence_0.667_Length_2326::g.58619::m.58619
MKCCKGKCKGKCWGNGWTTHTARDTPDSTVEGRAMPPKLQPWGCERCTYVNSGGAKSCKMCQAKRPTSTPSAPHGTPSKAPQANGTPAKESPHNILLLDDSDDDGLVPLPSQESSAHVYRLPQMKKALGLCASSSEDDDDLVQRRRAPKKGKEGEKETAEPEKKKRRVVVGEGGEPPVETAGNIAKEMTKAKQNASKAKTDGTEAAGISARRGGKRFVEDDDDDDDESDQAEAGSVESDRRGAKKAKREQDADRRDEGKEKGGRVETVEKKGKE